MAKKKTIKETIEAIVDDVKEVIGVDKEEIKSTTEVKELSPEELEAIEMTSKEIVPEEEITEEVK